MHSDTKKRRSFLALLFTAGDVRRYLSRQIILSINGWQAIKAIIKPGDIISDCKNSEIRDRTYRIVDVLYYHGCVFGNFTLHNSSSDRTGP